MNSIVMPKTVQLDESMRNQLAKGTVTEETLAAGACTGPDKKLTAADMWNLHRNSRSASSLIRRWNLN